MAPRTDAMNPAGEPSGYRPMALPTKVATNEPAIPSRIVTINPPGSFPGIKNFATAPMINPITSVQIISSTTSQAPDALFSWGWTFRGLNIEQGFNFDVLPVLSPAG